MQVSAQYEGGVFGLEKPRVSLYDDTAVVNLRLNLKGTINGREAATAYALLDVWRKRDGRWQLVTRHLERLTAPPQ